MSQSAIRQRGTSSTKILQVEPSFAAAVYPPLLLCRFAQKGTSNAVVGRLPLLYAFAITAYGGHSYVWRHLCSVMRWVVLRVERYCTAENSCECVIRTLLNRSSWSCAELHRDFARYCQGGSQNSLWLGLLGLAQATQ